MRRRMLASIGGAKLPTARDYVQDGLIAMWDGIENAGWGVHDEETSYWSDLVSLEKTDGFVFASNHVIAKAGELLPKTTISNPVRQLNTNGVSDIKTIEYGVRIDSYAADDASLFLVNPYVAYGFNSWGSRSTRRINFQFGESETFGISNHGQKDVNVKVSFEDGIIRFYYTINAGDVVKQILSKNFSRNCNNAAFGNNNTSQSFGGRVYFRRAYSRALTENEIMQNFAIDKVRFALP